MTIGCHPSEFCGLCYENRRGRANHRGHWGYKAKVYFEGGGLFMALKKRDIAVSSGEGMKPLTGGGFAKTHPLLWEHLSVALYADGSSRKLSSLTLFIDTDCVKVCLNDRDQGLAAFASGCNVAEAFLALEEGLAKDTLDWRRSQFHGKKGKK